MQAARKKGRRNAIICSPSLRDVDDRPAPPGRRRSSGNRPLLHPPGTGRLAHPGDQARLSRSEEHTSELQSLMRISYAVFCLKKKKKNNKNKKKEKWYKRYKSK